MRKHLRGHPPAPAANSARRRGGRENQPLKLYLISDVSRISGLLNGGQGLPPWYWFPKLEKDDLRLKMTAAINKAAEAALQAGAAEILAHEACPLEMLSLRPEVKIIRGAQSLHLDQSFAGIAFVGQGIAARATSSTGVEKNLRKIEFNRREVDEMTIAALYAGAQGVPVICASGAGGCFRIIKRFLPALITERDSGAALRRGLEQIGQIKPVTMRGRIEIAFHFGSDTLAGLHARLPNVVRTGKTTTAVRAANINAAFTAYCACGLAASADWLANPAIHKGGTK